MDEEERGFTVKDKRRIFKEGQSEAKESGADAKAEEAEAPRETESKEYIKSARAEIPLPEVNFTTFMLSLNSSALLHLGEIADPISKEKNRDLSLAKHTIDVIAMLQEKTKGNLTEDEGRLVDGILYDLRMRYVKQVGK
jgi:hypothetical protein